MLLTPPTVPPRPSSTRAESTSAAAAVAAVEGAFDVRAFVLSADIKQADRVVRVFYSVCVRLHVCACAFVALRPAYTHAGSVYVVAVAGDTFDVRAFVI